MDSPDFLGADPTAQITNQRRSALAMAYAYDQAYGPAFASATRAGLLAYHDALPGPTGAPARALPLNLPRRAALIAAHYNAVEDFDGATVAELVANILLTESDAAAVLRALGYTP